MNELSKGTHGWYRWEIRWEWSIDVEVWVTEHDSHNYEFPSAERLQVCRRVWLIFADVYTYLVPVARIFTEFLFF